MLIVANFCLIYFLYSSGICPVSSLFLLLVSFSALFLLWLSGVRDQTRSRHLVLFSLTEKRFSIVICQVYSQFDFYIGHRVLSMYTASCLVVQSRYSLERGHVLRRTRAVAHRPHFCFPKSVSSYCSWFFSLSYFSVPVSHNYECVFFRYLVQCLL